MSEEDYFRRVVDYEDKNNMYHPDQIDKSNNIDFIKTAYRAVHGLNDFNAKNLAKNYLSEGQKLRDEVKALKNEGGLKYTEEDMEKAFEAGAESIDWDERHGFSRNKTFEEFIKENYK